MRGTTLSLLGASALKHDVFVGVEVDQANSYLATHLVVDGVNVAYTRQGTFFDPAASAFVTAPRRLIQFIVESLLAAGLTSSELHHVLWGWQAV